MQSRPVVLLLVAGVVWSLALRGSSQSLAQPAKPPPPVVPVVPQPQAPATPVHAPPPVIAQNVADLPATIIAWDSTEKSAILEAGELDASFSFSFTNISDGPVTVTAVYTTCGCTTAKLPPLPWLIPAGSSDVLDITMNVAGKTGTVPKGITVMTDKGIKSLVARTTILPLPTASGMVAGAREENQMLALTDRQAVFKGDCATCHAEPATGLAGAKLYTAVCGVCHEAEHRASMVPDLKVAKQERNAEYWKNWITNGKEGSLMPAFAVSAGGVLTDEQIASLVDHLVKTLPTKPAPAAAGANVPAPAAH